MHITRILFALIATIFVHMLLSPVFVQALVTYTVNSDADTADANPGDGICDIGAFFSYCTLPSRKLTWMVQTRQLTLPHQWLSTIPPFLP